MHVHKGWMVPAILYSGAALYIYKSTLAVAVKTGLQTKSSLSQQANFCCYGYVYIKTSAVMGHRRGIGQEEAK